MRRRLAAQLPKSPYLVLSPQMDSELRLFQTSPGNAYHLTVTGHCTLTDNPRSVVLKADRTARSVIRPMGGRRVKSCDKLTVLFDLAFAPFKSFTVVGDFDIARLP